MYCNIHKVFYDEFLAMHIKENFTQKECAMRKNIFCFFVLAALAGVIFTGCPYTSTNEIVTYIFPEEEKVPVIPGDATTPTTYNITINMINNEADDLVTVTPVSGLVGASIILDYTVANIGINNQLIFSGVGTDIPLVSTAGSGTRVYKINASHASDNKITIIATFTHTNLTVDDISFADITDPVTKVYGDPAFANPINMSLHNGSGAISYSSSDTSVATVNSSGLVTIIKTGSSIITAEKAADEIFAFATASYTLIVSKAQGVDVAAPTLISNMPTSITVNTVSLPGNGQSIEYAINTVNDTTSLSSSDWQSSGTFSSLTQFTTYYIYARSVQNANFNSGMPSIGLKVIAGSYTITYTNMEGATNNIANPEIYIPQIYDITLEPPTKPNVYFIQWRLNSSTGTPASSIPAGSTGSKVFYAQWTTEEEFNIVNEVNNIRNNPSAYANILQAELLSITDPAIIVLYNTAINTLNMLPPTQPLTFDKRLYFAARDHAEDLINTNTYGHTSSDGTLFAARIQRYIAIGAAGEIIGSGPDIDTAEKVVKQWVLSSGNLNILLSNSYSIIGASLMPGHPTHNWISVLVVSQ